MHPIVIALSATFVPNGIENRKNFAYTVDIPFWGWAWCELIFC